MSKAIPIAIFDAIEHLEPASYKHLPQNYNQDDIKHALMFLKSYCGSKGTFNSYRREIERLLHWSTLIINKPLRNLKREDIEAFIKFCQDPPQIWIGTKKAPRFIVKNAERTANPEWRPFVAAISKAEHRNGKLPTIEKFSLSYGAIKELFAILSSFYNYLLQEEYVYMNPVALIRQKSKYIRRQQNNNNIRRLSDLQWKYVLETARNMAARDPDLHERTLFIMSILYSMYLRISELTATARWTPTMNNFYRDNHGNWWFVTIGKGNKQRQIAVSNTMLDSLKQWRNYLGLSPLPSITDNSPLIPKIKGKGPVTSTNHIRKIVQKCFDKAIARLQQDSFQEEADALIAATVHWLRHTGISDDVKRRPREHVRDDAGHSSSATTDKYIDIELTERHQSAKDKPLASSSG
jgi:site-specific recombinase XerD